MTPRERNGRARMRSHLDIEYGTHAARPEELPSIGTSKVGPRQRSEQGHTRQRLK